MTHPSTDPRSLPADVKRKLLAARDALTEGDAMEAYHQIYSIAAPHFDKLADEVWTGLESPSPEPAAGQPPKLYRLIPKFDPFMYQEFPTALWDLILIPQSPETKEGGL